MSVGDVIELARSHRPPADAIFSFAGYALAEQISENILARPQEYSQHASGFASLQPAYTGAFFNGLRQAIEVRSRQAPPDGPSPELKLAWEQVLDLAASVVGIPDPGGANAEQSADSARGQHRSVTELLKKALASPDIDLPVEHAETLLGILCRLLDSPDPSPDDETEDEAAHFDPAHRALNSVRGQAIGVLMTFIDWWTRYGGTENDMPTTFVQLLSGGLDPTREPSAAVRSVYGEHLSHLHAQLPCWTSEHLGTIFGPPATDQEINPSGPPAELPPPTLTEQLGQVAFDAYLLFNRPHGELWELLTPYYTREIVRLRRPPRVWRGAPRDTRQLLLDHLLLFLLWGVLDRNDPIVNRAIRSAGPQIAGDAVGHLGWRLYHADDVEPPVIQRAQDLWTWWRKLAARRAENGDRAYGTTMVAGFPWWWRADKLDTIWQFEELLFVLEISPAIETPTLVVRTISERVEGNEKSALMAVETIFDNTTDNANLHHVVTNAQSALRHLLKGPDEIIRRRTGLLLQKIAGWGLVELAKQISTLIP
jgi:hypothetical protein